MSFFDLFKKNNSKPEDTTIGYLDDITFIQDMKHAEFSPWHQYDILFAAKGYGWDMMINWVDYMTIADFSHVDQVTTGSMGAQEQNITESYKNSGEKCAQTPELAIERGMLSMAGMSKTLNAPMKIVWLNQTRVLRFFTLVKDEVLIRKYAETVIRRTFGTDDAMKLGKPIPKDQQLPVSK